MAVSLPVLQENDGDSYTIVTQRNEHKSLSLSVRIVQILKAEPDYTFLVSDLIDRTGAKPGSVRQAVKRLSSDGKGSGPVRKVSHGMYKYDPLKQENSLQALARSGNWRIENFTLVTIRAYPPLLSRSDTESEQAKVTPPSLCLPAPRAGYPVILPTGQLVAWEQYSNGTEVIRLSANGCPPFSADNTLSILHMLKNQGMEPDKWQCISLEVNVDSRTLRLDASYSIQLLEGLLLKCYQHGSNTRLELADRRKVPVREVIELFHAIAGGLDVKNTRRQVAFQDKRLSAVEKRAQLAYNIATKIRDGPRQECSNKTRYSHGR